MTTIVPRPTPDGLRQHYLEQGWWSDDTLGALVDRCLGDAPTTTVDVWSRENPWRGTYTDLANEARRLISVLRAHGLAPGDPVAFQLPNRREAITAFYALALGGFVLVPIVHIYGRKEVGFILRESGARAYISAPSFGPIDYTEIIDTEATDLADLELHLLTDEPTGSAPPGIDRIGWSAVDAAAPAEPVTGVDPDDVVVLAYTSGTTSDPKGVVHTHRTLLAELVHMRHMSKGTPPNLMGSPVTHATGMLGAVLTPIVIGQPIHVIDRWDPGWVLEIMTEADISAGNGASYFLASLLEHPDFGAEHAARMPRIGLGGAPVPVALGELAAGHGIKIIRAYGSTEHPSISGCDYEDAADKRHRTDGRPLAGVELRLVDEDGSEVAPGKAGEILSRGPELCVGYTDPDLTRATFDDDGWYRTGDMGVLDDDGYLTITDRVNDIIIRGGENISAAEVEDALAQLPGVAEVAVVAAPDARLGEQACALVRLAAGADAPGLGEMQAHLEHVGLARQKWPEKLQVVADFPRTATGKIRKIDLRRRQQQ
ncbi:MAG: AMP-binding protein [Acidimicrobiales bacterium]